jgi:Fe2+ or Zn2+ uptake regulation protein
MAGRKQKRDKADASAEQLSAESRVQAMLAGVRQSGLKVTPQRLAIVKELAADPTHPTAQELFERLRPSLPTMSFATVYNTLDALASAGLCAALSLSPGAARFDPNMGEHHHAVCDRCGLVRDVHHRVGQPDRVPPVEHPKNVELELDDELGFEIRSVERIYRGLCASCAKASANTQSL